MTPSKMKKILKQPIIILTQSEKDLIINLLEAHKSSYSLLLGFGKKTPQIIKQEKEIDRLINKIKKM